MLRLLMAAIWAGNEEAVIFFLKIIPPHMLMSVDENHSSILHYLARFNLLQALKEAQKIFAKEKFKEANDEHHTPFTAAIYYGRPSVVQFFEENGLDTFKSKMHRDAFYNTLTLPINVEDALLEDVAGMLPIYYAVAADNVAGTQLLLEHMPASKLSTDIDMMSKLIEMAVDNKHLFLLPLLANIFGKYNLIKILGYKSKRVIDRSENESHLIEKIEEKYDQPAAVVKQLLNTTDERALQEAIYFAAQYGCAKTLSGLLAGFQQDDEAGRHETIDAIMRITFKVYQVKATQEPSLMEKELLEVVAKACKADFEQHPDWLSIVLLPVVKEGWTYFVDTFLRNLSPTHKKLVMHSQLPNRFGITLLHAAVRYNQPETLLTMMAHGADLATTNAENMSVLKLMEVMRPQLLPGIYDKELAELYNQQTLYFQLLNRFIDTGKISKLGLEAFKVCITKLKALCAKYKAEKDEAFLNGLLKILWNVVKTDVNNSVLKELYFELSKEMSRVDCLPSKISNHIIALRFTLLMQGYDKAIEELGKLVLVKLQLNSLAAFNYANVPQFLIARMTLLTLKELDVVIPEAYRLIMANTLTSPRYNFLLGTFCLNFIDAKKITLNQATLLYKKMADVLVSVQKRTNLDLVVAELTKKRNWEIINSSTFKNMLVETETDVCIVYQWLNTFEKDLLERDNQDIEVLEIINNFYRFKKVMLELLDAAQKDLKKAADLIKYSLHLPNNYIVDLNQCDSKIKETQREIEKLKQKKLTPILAELSAELLEEKALIIPRPNGEEKTEKTEKNEHEKDDHKKDEHEKDEHEEMCLEVNDLPTYHPSEVDDRVWQGEVDESSAKVSLKIPGDKKKISVVLPLSVLRFMRSFGSDGCALVGGAVRDSIMGRKPKDWDFVANLSFDDLKKRFYHAEEKGLGAKTKSLLIKYNELIFDTFPSPNLEHKFYLEFLKEKAASRDFTCNALYINYFWNWREKKENWQIIDPFGGIYDIKMGRLRAIPTSIPFSDLLSDPVRLLRGLIFCDRFGFSGFEILLAAFNEKGITMYDALVSLDTFKLNMIGEKLSNYFKDRLGQALEKQGFLAPLIRRGLIKELPSGSQRFFYQPIQVAAPEAKETKVVLKKKK